MSLNIQNSIKSNQDELQDYLRDMKNWEKDIKKQELKLSDIKDVQREKTPPIRKRVPKNKSPPMNQPSTEIFKEEKKAPRISSYDYAGWDKFDVDKALNSDSEGELEENIDPSLHPNNSGQSQETPPQSKEERADKLKEEGNLCYSKGNFSDAIAKYTQGIGLNPTNPLIPANRAMAYIKLKKFKAAEKDCSQALKLDPKYIKAYLRRATALTHLSNNADAKKDYEMVLKLESWNKDAMRELEKLNRLTCDEETFPRSSYKGDLNINIKKLKMDEVSEEKKDAKEPLVHEHSAKPLLQQSQKPLKRLSIVEVDSREEMEAHLQPSAPPEQKTSRTLPKISKEPTPVEKPPSKPALPKIPRTSHQFSQDWKRVAPHQDLVQSYLLSIPHSFFRDTEFEVEILVEMFNALCDDKIDARDAASIIGAVTKSRGFYLNMAFLEGEQKKVLKKIVTKIEDFEAVKTDLNFLKDICQ